MGNTLPIQQPKRMLVQECPICLQPMIHDIIWLPCIHSYCKDCINQWAKKSRKCPLCEYSF